MGATGIGALIGGAIDSLSGDDSPADGAVIGAVTANVLKVVAPVVVTYAVGWAVLRGLTALRGGLATGPEREVGGPGAVGLHRRQQVVVEQDGPAALAGRQPGGQVHAQVFGAVEPVQRHGAVPVRPTDAAEVAHEIHRAANRRQHLSPAAGGFDQPHLRPARLPYHW